jgi:regulator of protease activity HflC (stomatin/prohibitin superfamily)
VIHAGGEAQASEKLAEAANILSVYPAAIQLRFLQTLTEVATEKNSTTILPLPIHLLTAFLQKKEKE